MHAGSEYLRLADGFVQGSSIMPQKRNPVALEHARAIGSKALGQATGVMLTVHNTPFGDIVDTEDDLQPLVHLAFRDATRTVRLVGAAMSGADFDRELMRRRASEHWITITELADTLTRDHDLPFRQSHCIAAALIADRRTNPERPLSEALASVSAAVTGHAIAYSDTQLTALLESRTLRRRAPDVGWTGAGHHRGCRRRCQVRRRSRLPMARRHAHGPRCRDAPAPRSRGRPLMSGQDPTPSGESAMRTSYVRVFVVEVLVLAGLWLFQQYFTR